MQAPSSTTKLLDVIKLTPLMEVTKGRGEIVVELIDGLVAKDHPVLSGVTILNLSEQSNNQCN